MITTRDILYTRILKRYFYIYVSGKMRQQIATGHQEFQLSLDSTLSTFKQTQFNLRVAVAK